MLVAVQAPSRAQLQARVLRLVLAWRNPVVACHRQVHPLQQQAAAVGNLRVVAVWISLVCYCYFCVQVCWSKLENNIEFFD